MAKKPKPFWSIWSSNFPLSIEAAEAFPEADMPAGLNISRAGAKIFISEDELKMLMTLHAPAAQAELASPVSATPKEHRNVR